MKRLLASALLLGCAGAAMCVNQKQQQAKTDATVETASEDSFPASDPPAWTKTSV